MMKLEISVPEALEIFKEIKEKSEKLFDMIRVDIQEKIGQFLTNLMKSELTHFLVREQYERIQGDTNHRNGSYKRNYTLKGIGEVRVEMPRDRKGEFKSQVIPRNKRYEDILRQEMCLMFLTGVSTRALSMISTQLIGRKISPTEASNPNKELIDAVVVWRTRDLSSEPIKYLFVGGVCLEMRIDKCIESIPVLVVIE